MNVQLPSRTATAKAWIVGMGCLYLSLMLGATVFALLDGGVPAVPGTVLIFVLSGVFAPLLVGGVVAMAYERISGEPL